MCMGEPRKLSTGADADYSKREKAFLAWIEQERDSKASAPHESRREAATLERDLRPVIHYLVTHQYEDGWKQVTDIDVLSDKILDAVRIFLDFCPDFTYNGFIKRGKENEPSD
jgi:hypothetical protein